MMGETLDAVQGTSVLEKVSSYKRLNILLTDLGLWESVLLAILF